MTKMNTSRSMRINLSPFRDKGRARHHSTRPRSRASWRTVAPRGRRYLDHPIELELPRSSDIGVNIDFLVADLKLLTDGSMKIFELGGLGSRLKGYYHLHHGRNPRSYDLKRTFLDIVSSLGKPMVTFSDFTSVDTSLKRRGIVGFLDLPLMGGMLMSQAAFERVHAMRTGPAQTLSDVRAIILNPYVPDYYADRPVLYINERTALATMSKLSLLRVMREEMPRFCPKTLWVHDGHSFAETLQRAKKTFGSGRVVFKPTSMSGGRGIEYMSRDDLPFALPELMDEGGGERKRSYLLQEYIPGKPVRSPFTGHLYDPTMRFIFGALVEPGRAFFYPLDAYWKLPTQPLGPAGRGRDSSSVYGREISLPVRERDYLSVVNGMKEFVATYYARRHTCLSRWRDYALYEQEDILQKLGRVLQSMTGQAVHGLSY